MTPLIIEPGEYSPKVVLDPAKNIFEFSGESYTENTRVFYMPILQWLEQYQNALHQEKDKPGQSISRVFEFRFNYFNSTSAKFIMDVLMHLDRIAEEGYNIKAKWNYDKHNEDMKESGEEFAKLISVPFEFAPIE